jgi:hypothetical protein
MRTGKEITKSLKGKAPFRKFFEGGFSFIRRCDLLLSNLIIAGNEILKNFRRKPPRAFEKDYSYAPMGALKYRKKKVL